MALIDIEGGDHMTNGLFTAKGWTVNPDQVVAGRVRGKAWKMQAGPVGSNIQKVFASSYPSVVAGLAFEITGGLIPGTASKPIFSLYTAAGALIGGVNTDVSSHLVVVNSGGTTIGTGTTNIALNTWYYIELKLVVGTSGSCELHLNGVPGEIASTTGSFGTTNVGRINFQRPGNNQSDVSIDDLYVLDLTGSSPLNDFLGDVTVETLYPQSDGTHQDWTPNTAGAHYSKVNESSGTYPDDDTTYVSDVTPGAIDTYTVGSLAALTGTVYGVATNLYARKDDAAARTIAPVIREAGTDYAGATTGGLTTSYLFYRQLYPLDPAGAAWTIASVNGAEYGVKEVS